MLTPRRICALLLLAALWLSPLPRLATGSMVLHMVLHLSVTVIVPAMLAFRLPLPNSAVWLAAGALMEAVIVWAWHLPSLHVWARMTTTGFVLEQASFLLAGLLLWTSVRSAGNFGGAIVLLVTTMHMTLLGALIGLAPRLLYGSFCAGYLGLDALEEQQIAGILMAGAGGAMYLAAALRRIWLALETSEAFA